jgi:hypothetical protein
MEPSAMRSRMREMFVSTRRMLDASDAFRAAMRPTRVTGTKKRARVDAA